MKNHLLAAAVVFCSLSAMAQWSVTTLGSTTDTITFDATFSGVTNGTFTGDGLEASPASGRLDSDAWKITGMSDGSSSFGGTATSGDFARGSSSGGVVSGGTYAFEVMTGDTALGVQPGGSDWTPGDIILRLINNTGSNVDSVYVGYDLYVYNDQGRGNTFNFSYAVNDSTSFTAVPELNDTSTETASATPAWVAFPKSAMVYAPMSNGDTLYLVWTGNDAVGGGSRDEFALDNIAVELYEAAPAPTGLPTYPISMLNTEDVDGVADSLGVQCFTQGVVMGVDLRGGAGYSFTIWDNGGINVFSTVDVDGYVVTEGDSVFLRGTVGQYNGLTQFEPDSIALINSGNSIPPATVVTSLDESTESELVRVENFWVQSISGSNYTLSNGTNDVVMRIDDDTDIPGNVTFALGDTICYVIGIGGQFDFSSPFTGGYQFFPQRAADIDNSCGSIPPAPVPYYPIADINNDDSLGMPDSIGVYCWTKGVVLGIDFDGNAGLSFTLWDEEGINIFNFNDVSNYVVAEGDSLMVRGTIDFYNGLTELFVDSIEVINSGNPVPDPMEVNAPAQSTESEPIVIQNVRVIDPAQWPNGSSSGWNIDLLTCNNDTIVMRIDSDTDIDENWPAAPNGLFHVRGIGGQFDNSSPFLDNYQIFPVYPGDLDTNASSGALLSIVINELMANNTSTIEDENGEFDSWIELYNPSSTSIDLAGIYMSDDASQPMKYQVPASSTATLDANGYTLVWADNQSAQGDLHTNFTLNAGGGFVSVSQASGCETQTIDSIDYIALGENESYGREADGGTPWVIFSEGTPNAMNQYLAVEEASTSAFKAWPNPNNGGLLYFNQPVSYKLYNVMGQLVMTGINTNQANLSALDNGIYLVETITGEAFKVIVK
ncbi:MAG: lamin tail domain-containing protein [Salibacteraceae bacterium]